MLSDLVKQVNLDSQMQNNFRDTFQGQLTFPPPLPPIGRPEPLTVPDFPPPFYSSAHHPPLLPPPVQDSSVNILQLVRQIESQQQLEITELQFVLQQLKGRNLQSAAKIVQHVEQTKIDLIENLILLCQAKQQSIRLVLNLNNTVEYYRI